MTELEKTLDAIGALPDGEIDIADAALQLARVDAPEADWRAARQHLTTLARDAVAAGPEAGDDLARRIAALAGLIGGRHRYRGDTETYDDLANANLIRVIERRRGMPVALGIIWLHCAQAAGWPAHGIDFPGHFLISIAGEGGQAVIDVFDGGTPLDSRHLRALLKRQGGESAELRPGLLRTMPNRDVLLRLQQNVKGRRLQAGDYEAALACVETMLRIAPAAAAQWRDAALINRQLDRVGAALRCYEKLLELVPAGDAASRVKAAMDELRTRLN